MKLGAKLSSAYTPLCSSFPTLQPEIVEKLITDNSEMVPVFISKPSTRLNQILAPKQNQDKKEENNSFKYNSKFRTIEDKEDQDQNDTKIKS